MTDFAALLQPDCGQAAHEIQLVGKAGFEDWLTLQSPRVQTTIAAARFKAAAGSVVIVPGDDPADWSVVAGKDDSEDPWLSASLAAALPEGSYRFADTEQEPSALGWLLAHHRFDRYLSKPDTIPERVLLTSAIAAIDETIRLAEATALVRDLVDTPAGDMGPAELADAVRKVAERAGAEFRDTAGDALEQHYPMIAAVGRAAIRQRSPRLIELEWGDPSHPRIAIVGKGICFDSGGLDIKPSSAMLWMKKDMGGAAHALALADLIMGLRLPVRLHLIIPAAENALSGDAFRPGDILKSRDGMTVEIGNTDAEGRLVLGDAITRACEDAPALMIDFATLTGAARVALGPDLPALFANDDQLADDFTSAGQLAGDPLWRLPLWKPYAKMLDSNAADINNAGEGGMAGAITAALFLERFVTNGIPWAHIDTFSWRSAAKPGRPKGGEALGLRAAWQLLKTRYQR